MPIHNHLTPAEIRDFKPGYWNNGDWLMPAGAAQVMQDCYPQVGGGIRAFFEATTITVSGITAPTKERPIGLHARGGVGARSGSPTDLTDRYLLTYFFDASGPTARPRLYRMDGSNSETTWTQIKKVGAVEFSAASSGNNAPSRCRFLFYKTVLGSPDNSFVMLALDYVGTDAGIWKLNYNDLSSAQHPVQVSTTATPADNARGAMAVHQARLMVAAGPYLIWTDPGTLTFAADNFLQIDPEQDLPGITALAPIEPSDLMVLREGSSMILVQGDITSPTVQAMAQGVFGGQQEFGRTPEGLVLISTDHYVQLTNGMSVSNISQQLAAFAPMSGTTGQGSLSMIGEFLFAPNGHVFHFPTKSWFKQTQIPSSLHNVEPYTNQIWGTTSEDEGFGLKTLNCKPTDNRVNTYTWKSAPIHGDDGRQAVIRMVDLIVRTYDDAATLAVTVNGTTRTKTVATAGKQIVSFLFNERGPVLDVQVVPTAGNAAHEAPSIEAIRTWTRSGHNVTPY